MRCTSCDKTRPICLAFKQNSAQEWFTNAVHGQSAFSAVKTQILNGTEQNRTEPNPTQRTPELKVLIHLYSLNAVKTGESSWTTRIRIRNVDQWYGDGLSAGRSQKWNISPVRRPTGYPSRIFQPAPACSPAPLVSSTLLQLRSGFSALRMRHAL